MYKLLLYRRRRSDQFALEVVVVVGVFRSIGGFPLGLVPFRSILSSLLLMLLFFSKKSERSFGLCLQQKKKKRKAQNERQLILFRD